MKKTSLLWVALLAMFASVIAQPPTNYYGTAVGKSGNQLLIALHDIIDDHTSVSYDQLWISFRTTDDKPSGKVWDIYSDIPDGTPYYEFTFDTDQCGNYSGEGDCYNREHSVPKSWFGDAYPMYSDLFHLYPTDGYVNNRRGNNPLGEVSSPTWTSTNGSKVGNNTYPGYSGTAFEPIDEYKGDLARSYFYMSVRYSDENLGQETNSMFQGSELKSWALAMLMEWHEEDPVSQKEIDRNNEIDTSIQHNRNPFIDCPELVDQIFGSGSSTPWYPTCVDFDTTSISNHALSEIVCRIFPNPARNKVMIDAGNNVLKEIGIYDPTGKLIRQMDAIENNVLSIDINSLTKGFYILIVRVGERTEIHKLMVY